MNEQSGLDQIRVKRETLLETLIANRDAHREIFEEAMDGYRAKSIELLEEHITRIKEGRPERVLVSLPMPEDHTDDYDRVIQMIEWSLDSELWLTGHEFDRFVRDNWEWKGAFAASTVGYMSGG